MPTNPTRAGYAVLLTLAALVTSVSCGRQLQRLVSPNQPPDVRIVSSDFVAGPTTDAVRTVVRWRGSDPDGRVDHYLVAVNPRSLDTPDVTWQRTTETEWVASGVAGQPMVVAVRAVDARGVQSVTAYRAFLDDNQTPLVRITVPPPSVFFTQLLKSGQTIRWTGADPDGPGGLPVGYKFRFFSEADDLTPSLIAADPDSVRRLYAPNYDGWESTEVESASVAVPDAVVGSMWTLVVVAVDAEGATTAVFSLETNILRFRIAHPATPLGPRLTVFNEWFTYSAPAGIAPANPPSVEQTLQIDPRRPVTLNWFAEPRAGLNLGGYRWALDIADVFDETPRHNKNDLEHWSQLSLTNTSATVGPFHGIDAKRDHVVYIEAADELGDVSLVAIRLRAIPVPLDHELLIVDDTRFNPDRVLSNGMLDRPRGRWPTAAELDTFLYARGGFPWQGYPEGTLSSTGLFAAFEFDTIGTRIGRADLTVPLETLLQYRHVVWITDGLGATNNRSGTDATQPQTALRYMTGTGRTNTLATYVTFGGKLWVVGGGVGYASCISHNDPSNDRPTTTFRSGEARFNELGPGRFMWDLVHWRSAFRVANVPVGSIDRTAPSTRGGMPNYSRMPVAFEPKTPATDPLPPFRVASDFYRNNLDLEFLIDPNDILEDAIPGQPERLVSVLDTLYQANAMSVGPAPPPVVTYYRGREHPPVLFSGMDLWNYRRSQCQQMVNAVLQGLWHLPPASGGEPVRRGRPALSASGNPTRTPRSAAATTAADRYRGKR